MAIMYVTKLNGETGTKIWSYESGDSTWANNDTCTPIRLHWSAGTLFVLTTADQLYDGPDIQLQLVDSASGVGIRAVHLSDHNAAHRDNDSDPGKKSALVTGDGATHAAIATTNTHIVIASPRVFLGEGTLHDAGNIWAIPRDDTYPVSDNLYSIAVTDPTWAIETNTSYESIPPETMQAMLYTTQENTTAPFSIIEDVDYLYTLPPATSDVYPSLEVVNIASVGQLIVGDTTSPPSTNKGRAGDLAGMVRFSMDGVYYCTDDYIGDGTSIWVSAPFSGADMARYKAGPIGFEPSYGVRCGIPGDKAGDLRMCGQVLFICTSDYATQTSNIWFPIAQYQIGTGISTSVNQNYDVTDDPAYPTGYELTQYTNTLSVASSGIQIYDWSVGTTLYMSQAKGQINKYLPTYDGFTVWVGNPYYSYSNWTATIVNSSPTYPLRIQDGWGASFNGVSQLIIAPRQSVDLFLDGSVFRTLNIREANATVSLNVSGTTTIDARLTTNYRLVLVGNTTLGNPTNLVDGIELTFIVIQDGTGFTRTMSYGTMFKWAGGVVPTLSIGANKVDMITATYHAISNTLLCNIIKDIR